MSEKLARIVSRRQSYSDACWQACNTSCASTWPQWYPISLLMLLGQLRLLPGRRDISFLQRASRPAPPAGRPHKSGTPRPWRTPAPPPGPAGPPPSPPAGPATAPGPPAPQSTRPAGRWTRASSRAWRKCSRASPSWPASAASSPSSRWQPLRSAAQRYCSQISRLATVTCRACSRSPVRRRCSACHRPLRP